MEQTAKLYCGLRASTHLRVGDAKEIRDEQYDEFITNHPECCAAPSSCEDTFDKYFRNKNPSGVPHDKYSTGIEDRLGEASLGTAMDILKGYCKKKF
jgi:hypothetical protein